MPERIDSQTGEVTTLPKMPPEVARAVVAVMKKVKQLGYDDTNPHQKYKYTSIDKFLATFGPMCAEAGLFIVIDEDSVEVRKAVNEQGRETGWLFTKYRFTLFHETGAEYGPLYRTVMVPGSGAQAFGSAQSYLLKQFMRALFMVPTGEKDIDDQDKRDLPQNDSLLVGMQRLGGAGQPAEQGPAQAPPKAAAPLPVGLTEQDRDYARTAFMSIRPQLAQADTAELVDKIMESNAKNIDLISKISPPNGLKLKEMAEQRKKMLAEAITDDGEPTP